MLNVVAVVITEMKLVVGTASAAINVPVLSCKFAFSSTQLIH